FRRSLASMPLAATFPSAALGLLMSAACFTTACFAATYLTGDSIEEVQEEATLLGKIAMSGYCVLWGTLGVFIAALQTFYVTLPVSGLTVLLLRGAVGGASGDRTVPSAARG